MKMKKVVLDKSALGFLLSDEAEDWLRKHNFGTEYKEEAKTTDWFKKIPVGEEEKFLDKHLFFDVTFRRVLRDDPLLVECVESLGKKANGKNSNLFIEEYDDENYLMSIETRGEYDDGEYLVLEPIVSEIRIEKCSNTKEIVEYLKSLGIYVKEKEN